MASGNKTRMITHIGAAGELAAAGGACGVYGPGGAAETPSVGIVSRPTGETVATPGAAVPAPAETVTTAQAGAQAAEDEGEQ